MNEDLTSPGSSFGTPPWLKSQNSPSIQIKIPMAFVKMGFGYDNSRNIYKVVSMVVKAQSRKTEVASWFDFLDGQYVKGTLNRIATLDTDNPNQCQIYSFDLRDEKYKYLLLPSDLNKINPLTLCMDICLSLFHYHMRSGFSFWQMNEFGAACGVLDSINAEFYMLVPSNFWSFFIGNTNGGYLKTAMSSFWQRDNRVERIEIPFKKLWLHSTDYVQSLIFPY
ncbi:hypothetical protein JHK86_045951 [Glycine max]|nr:hypothetical protein JHK86_045951 [Glycine max]